MEQIADKKSSFVKKYMQVSLKDLMTKNKEVESEKKGMKKSLNLWNNCHDDILQGKYLYSLILTSFSVQRKSKHSHNVEKGIV